MGTQQPLPSNEVSSEPDKRLNEHLTRETTERQRMFSGACSHFNNKVTKPLIANQESGRLRRMTYPTRNLVNNGQNELRKNRHQRSRIKTQNSLVKSVAIRVTQRSQADTETPALMPTEVSHTNGRTQMRIEASAKTSKWQANNSSPSSRWKKLKAKPPTLEMKPTTLTL